MLDQTLSLIPGLIFLGLLTYPLWEMRDDFVPIAKGMGVIALWVGSFITILFVARLILQFLIS